LVLALWRISAQPAAAQSTTLHVGFNGFYGAAPLYVAQDAGIFRKHGFTLVQRRRLRRRGLRADPPESENQYCMDDDPLHIDLHQCA
jgi:hypothetical protein